MAFRERSNSAGKILIGWIKDSFLKDRDERPKKPSSTIPKRATSTPYKRRSSSCINDSLNLSEIDTHVNFADLYAFGEEGNLGHPDFDNDITAYSFYNQITPVNTEKEWKAMGGDAAYKKMILSVYDIYLERPMPREVFHLAIYYLQTYVKNKTTIKAHNMEDFAVAIVDMAAKVERQTGCRLGLLEEHSVKDIFAIQKQICKMANFCLWPTTMPFFMRILNINVCTQDWHWQCAKAYSDLMLCERELTEIVPSLAAGVVMYIISLIDKNANWNDNCYAIIQQPKEAYRRPLAILCRVIMCLLDSPRTFEPLYSKHEKVFRYSQRRRAVFQDEIDYAEFNNIF